MAHYEAYELFPEFCSCPDCVAERLAKQEAEPQMFRFYSSYVFSCLDCHVEVRCEASQSGDSVSMNLDKLFLSKPCAHRRFRIETT